MFDNWSEATKYISFLWLLAQGLFLIFHMMFMKYLFEELKNLHLSGGTCYLVLCSGVLIIIGILIANMYSDYAGCGATSFWFITITLVMGIITTGISLLNTVNKGLLTPCIMFLYSALMCWDALLSIPSSYCDNDTTSNSIRTGDATAMAVMLLVTSTIVIYCVLNGSVILNVFNLMLKKVSWPATLGRHSLLMVAWESNCPHLRLVSSIGKVAVEKMRGGWYC